MKGVSGLTVKLGDGENSRLNALGINALRSFPNSGTVVWGARTLDGTDQLASEWAYVPVRRLALFIEESIDRGTGWAAFECRTTRRCGRNRLNVGAFMDKHLFRQGAFAGQTPKDAYYVRCDTGTMTQDDINRGRVIVVVGSAPLKPAEFVVVRICQIARQSRAPSAAREWRMIFLATLKSWVRLGRDAAPSSEVRA